MVVYRQKNAKGGRDMSTFLAMSVSGGALILVIAVLRALFAQRLPRRLLCALWAVALLRLLLPVFPPSPLSLFPAVESGGGEALPAIVAAPTAAPQAAALPSRPTRRLPRPRPSPPRRGPRPCRKRPRPRRSSPRRSAESPAPPVWPIVHGSVAALLLILLAALYARGLRRFRASAPCEDEYARQWLARHPAAPPAAPAPLRRHRRAADLRPVAPRHPPARGLRPLRPGGARLRATPRTGPRAPLRRALQGGAGRHRLPALVQPACLGDAGARQPRSRTRLRRAGPARRRPRAPPRLRPRPFAAGGDARASPAAGLLPLARAAWRSASPPSSSAAPSPARRWQLTLLLAALTLAAFTAPAAPASAPARPPRRPASGQRRSRRFRHARALDHPRTARPPRDHLPHAPARGSLRRLRALRPQIRRRRPPPRLVGRALLHGHGPLPATTPPAPICKTSTATRTSSPSATNTAR